MVEFTPMALADYPAALALWRQADGVRVGAFDTEADLARFLARNPGLSLLARREGKLVGAVLCGHDGRVGYLHHLAVSHDARRLGIGSALVTRCLAALAAVGIPEAYAFVQTRNAAGRQFWRSRGWNSRGVDTFSIETAENPQPTAKASA